MLLITYWGHTDDRQMLIGRVNVDEEMRPQGKCTDLITPERSDDRRAIRERDVIVDRSGPKSLRERNTRIIHDTTFTTEISADVHLRLVDEASAHSGDVRGGGCIQIDRL